MPSVRHVSIPLAGLPLADTSSGDAVDLGGLQGVHVLVLLRHRH